MEKMVTLLVANREQIGAPYRIYVPSIDTFDKVSIEVEFESLEEYEKGWAEWFARPETAAFVEKWSDLTESGGHNEIWTLA